jgi:hypothetical protein
MGVAEMFAPVRTMHPENGPLPASRFKVSPPAKWLALILLMVCHGSACDVPGLASFPSGDA